MIAESGSRPPAIIIPKPFMLQFIAVILSGLVVAVADALIKKTSNAGSFAEAVKNPWMIAVAVLYILQIGFFIYVFNHQWKLGIVSNIQIVFFSIAVVLIGYFFFQEKISTIQIAGIILAISGVILMNFQNS